jgi:hypothetical protein
MQESDQKIYQEIGADYRFFMGWRHAAFAGYVFGDILLKNNYAGSHGIKFLTRTQDPTTKRLRDRCN